MLASLPSALVLAALVAAALFGCARLAEKRPGPFSPRRQLMAVQRGGALVLACLIASAVVPLVCFMLIGADYPIFVFASGAASVRPPIAVEIVAYLAVCAAVGFYEEGAFRVVLPDLFARGFSGNGVSPARCRLYAVLLASVLFAALHAASSAPADADSLQVALQAALKVAQGLLFALAMAGLLAKTGSLPLIVAVHACYDALFFLPWMLEIGAFPSTYLTGLPIDTAALAAVCLCLVPAAAVSFRQLVCGGAVQRGMR